MDTVVDHPERQRFELDVDGKIAFVAYRRGAGVIQLDHAEVPAELEGRGVGSRLVKATLEAVRTEGLKVKPRCSFVAAYMRRHPEYADMLA